MAGNTGNTNRSILLSILKLAPSARSSLPPAKVIASPVALNVAPLVFVTSIFSSSPLTSALAVIVVVLLGESK